MESLITMVNKLQDAFSVLGHSPLSLPQIAVVGGQSAGKSSVLENIVGRDFLPRGSGIVTRRPLVLKLVNEPGLAHDWAEFLHREGVKYHDYAEIRNEIAFATENDPRCQNKGISSVPINLTIHSASVLNLTLIDLPGLTRIAVGDQPEDIMVQIRAMIMEYICQENTIILAVSPANQDLANSDAIQLAKEVDPDGFRTVGVLTKLDLMDRGTDAMNVLNNEVVPLRLGYIPVVNRSQHDIDTDKDIKSQWAEELKYFSGHEKYRSIVDRCGTQFLAKTLNKTLVGHIKACLPDITSKITDFMGKRRLELAELEELGDETKKQQLVLETLCDYSNSFKGLIEGRNDDAPAWELSGGAKIAHIFHSTFRKNVEAVDVLAELTPANLRNIIRNCTGLDGGLFIPDEAFRVVLRQAIRRLEEPAMACVQMVYDELLGQIRSLETPAMARFAVLRERVHGESHQVISGHMEDTRNLVRTLIEMETCMINSRHPHFKSNVNIEDMMRDEDGDPTGDDAVPRLPTARVIPSNPNKGPRGNMLISGWIEKETSRQFRGSKFEKRFAEVNDRILSYSKDQRGGELKDVDLRGATVRKQGTTDFEVTPAAPGSKTYLFRCGDASTADKWIHSCTVASDEAAWQALKSGQASLAHKRNSSAASMAGSDAGEAKAASPAASTRHQRQRSRARPSPSMTQSDITQTRLIEQLIESYFEIVRVKVLDSIPKAITLRLVNKVATTLQTSLVRSLYSPSLVNDLLSETEEDQMRREKLREVLRLMEQAMATIRDVQAGRGLETRETKTR